MPRPRGKSNRPHPNTSLATALQVAETIAGSNASRPMNRLLLADAMGYSPSSSGFRGRISAAAKYGLTEGNYNSENICLTPLAEAATRPRNESERIEAKRIALRTVPVFNEMIEYFGNARLPDSSFLKNILERNPFNVDPDWSESVAQAFTEDAREVGFLRDIGGSPHIVLDASGTPSPATDTPREQVAQPPDANRTLEDGDPPDKSSIDGSSNDIEVPIRDSSPSRRVPMQLFLAHGSNRKPLEQLKDILNSWKVPFLAAVDEANAGRPISEKVADTMRQCSAGIFIFTADEHYLNDSRETVSRPSQNVVYELGAASLLYGRKIVILKEVGVTFPSDFSDLGWIEFDTDALDAKAMDLLREMIALDAVRLVSAGSV